MLNSELRVYFCKWWGFLEDFEIGWSFPFEQHQGLVDLFI